MATIIVKDLTRDAVLAQGELGRDVILHESSYYFAPDHVNQDHLVTTHRTYVCPYKGTCYWIDLDGPNGLYRDVAWVYPDPNPGYEHIQDKIGFAPGIRPGIVVEKA